MTGEGLFAPRFESLFPVANEIVVEAEAACGLGDGVALLGDELDGLRFELRGVGASRSCHVGPPKSEFTLLSGCPPFVGRSKQAVFLEQLSLDFLGFVMNALQDGRIALACLDIADGLVQHEANIGWEFRRGADKFHTAYCLSLREEVKSLGQGQPLDFGGGAAQCDAKHSNEV